MFKVSPNRFLKSLCLGLILLLTPFSPVLAQEAVTLLQDEAQITIQETALPQEDAQVDTQANANPLTITTPGQNLKIASGRSFYVFGDIGGDNLPDDAFLTINLTQVGYPQNSRVVITGTKNNQNLDVYNDSLSYYNDETKDPKRQKLIDSQMPDLVFDSANPDSFKNATLKCTYTDNHFYAMIHGGYGTEAVDDKMGFVDHNGDPYATLSDGNYTITAHLTTKDGVLLGEATKAITVGDTADQVLARFSPKAHMDKVTAFANTNGYTLFLDSFPAYWDQSVFAEIKTLWRAADLTEYQTGKAHCILYNVGGSSTTYSVELANFEARGLIDTPERISYYYYDIGEPSLTDANHGIDLDGNIVAMDAGDKLALTRCDLNAGTSQDNAFNTADPNLAATDTNLSDGVNAVVGQTISLNGVTAPIQLDAADIVDNGDNSYTLKNKISRLHYTITGEGVKEAIDKAVTTLVRTDAQGWTNPSELEFRHDFTVDESMANKDLTVTVTGYDAYGTEVAGAQESFTLKVTSPTPSPSPSPSVSPTTVPTVTAAPASSAATPTTAATLTTAVNASTGMVGNTALPIIALLFLGALILIVFSIKKTRRN